MASDLTGTTAFWDQRGDVAFRERNQNACKKLYVDSSGRFALGICGLYDEATRDLLRAIVSGKIDLGKAIKEGGLKELERLNVPRCEGRNLSDEKSTSMLIASRGIRSQEPKLHTLWPLGKIEERSWTSIGSGSKYAINYIGSALAQKGVINLVGDQRVDIPRGIAVATRAIDCASTDIYTGGLDLVVVRHNGINQYGEEIGREFEKAGKRVMARIIKKEKSD